MHVAAGPRRQIPSWIAFRRTPHRSSGGRGSRVGRTTARHSPGRQVQLGERWGALCAFAELATSGKPLIAPWDFEFDQWLNVRYGREEPLSSARRLGCADRVAAEHGGLRASLVAFRVTPSSRACRTSDAAQVGRPRPARGSADCCRCGSGPRVRARRVDLNVTAPRAAKCLAPSERVAPSRKPSPSSPAIPPSPFPAGREKPDFRGSARASVQASSFTRSTPSPRQAERAGPSAR